MNAPTTVLVVHAGWRIVLREPGELDVRGPDGRLAATVPTLKEAEACLLDWLPNG